MFEIIYDSTETKINRRVITKKIEANVGRQTKKKN